MMQRIEIQFISRVAVVFISLIFVLQLSYSQTDSVLVTKQQILNMTYDDLLDLPFEQVINYARIAGVPVDELFDMLVSTAGKKEEKVSEIPASVIIVTRKEIEIQGYTSLTQILENIPGLYNIDSYHADGPSFGVRGFWSENANSNIVFMVNGVKQTFGYSGANPLSKIIVPVEAIERIEVVRGPMSVIYGNGAFFGAINVITDNQIDNPDLRIISVSGGSLNSRKAFIRIAGHENKLRYNLNASFFDTDGLDLKFCDMSERFSDTGKVMTTKNTLEESQRYISFSGEYRNFDCQVDVINNDKEGYLFGFPLKDGSLTKIQATNFLLAYNHLISNKLKFNYKIIYGNNRMITIYDRFIKNLYSIDNIENSQYELEINNFYKVLPNLEITSGLNYKAIPSLLYVADQPWGGAPLYCNAVWQLNKGEKIQNYGAFCQAEYSPVKNLKLVAGLRLDKNQGYGFHIKYAYDSTLRSKVDTSYSETHQIYRYANYENKEGDFELIPRFAAIYAINDKNVLKFLFGRAIKTPSFESVSDSKLLDYQLNPEYINTLELNYTSQPVSKIKLSMSLFRNKLDNLISRKYTYQSGVRYSVLANTGELLSHGIELTIISNPFKNFNFEISGTLQKTNDLRNGYKNLTREYSPNLQSTFKADYTLFNNLIFSISAFCVSNIETKYELFENFPDDDPYYQDGRIGSKTIGYVNFNSNIRYDNILGTKLYFNAKTSNLFNSKQYFPTTTYSEWAKLGTLRTQRTFYFSLGLKF